MAVLNVLGCKRVNKILQFPIKKQRSSSNCCKSGKVVWWIVTCYAFFTQPYFAYPENLIFIFGIIIYNNELHYNWTFWYEHDRNSSIYTKDLNISTAKRHVIWCVCYLLFMGSASAKVNASTCLIRIIIMPGIPTVCCSFARTFLIKRPIFHSVNQHFLLLIRFYYYIFITSRIAFNLIFPGYSLILQLLVFVVCNLLDMNPSPYFVPPAIAIRFPWCLYYRVLK